MVVTIQVSDKVAELLESVAMRFERITGRKLNYGEVIEILLTKLESVISVPDDTWF